MDRNEFSDKRSELLLIRSIIEEFGAPSPVEDGTWTYVVSHESGKMRCIETREGTLLIALDQNGYIDRDGWRHFSKLLHEDRYSGQGTPFQGLSLLGYVLPSEVRERYLEPYLEDLRADYWESRKFKGRGARFTLKICFRIRWIMAASCRFYPAPVDCRRRESPIT